MMPKIKYFNVLFLILALLILSTSFANTKIKKKSTDPWSMLKGQILTSVVWSPKGDSIAFVAANENDESDSEFGLLRANIWLTSPPRQNQATKLRHLIKLTYKQGIPVALFWIENKKIGWASAKESSFGFMCMGLDSSKPKPMISQRFNGYQSTGDLSGFSAPDDIYYDTTLNTLYYTAAYAPNNDVYLKIISLSAKKVRKLSVPHIKGLTYPKGYVKDTTFCFSSGKSNKKIFYLASGMLVDSFEGSGNYLWRSDSEYLRSDKVLIAQSSLDIRFPRLSSDGKLLAYIFGKMLALYNLETEKHKELVKISYGDFIGSPAIGCPFSWSPDGKEIAYVDKSKIKIISVVSP